MWKLWLFSLAIISIFVLVKSEYEWNGSEWVWNGLKRVKVSHSTATEGSGFNDIILDEEEEKPAKPQLDINSSVLSDIKKFMQQQEENMTAMNQKFDKSLAFLEDMEHNIQKLNGLMSSLLNKTLEQNILKTLKGKFEIKLV